MTTDKDKKLWGDRLKTADNAYLSEILHNFGLSGGFSLKDIPYIPLTGMAAAGVGSKIKELRERHRQQNEDTKNIDDFSGYRNDLSKVRNVVDRLGTEREPAPNSIHPSVPGFEPKVTPQRGGEEPYDWADGPYSLDDGPYDWAKGPYSLDDGPYDWAKERANTRSPRGERTPETNVFDIKDGRPLFNSIDQGKEQKGRPFGREEE